MPVPAASAASSEAAWVRPEPRSVGVSTTAKWAILFLVAFLLAFPKGGFKVAGVPFTWGYLALPPLFLAFPLALAAGRAAPIGRVRLVALLAMVPFQLIAFGSFLAYGMGSMAFGIAFLVTYFFLPAAFVLAFAPWIDRVDLGWLLGWVRRVIFFLAVYGIFLQAFRMITGQWIEIPFLTVNQGDMGALDDKMIDRGNAFKLISTYNNGNLYGVALLILLPLYCWTEKRGWKTAVVKLSLLLTLSRTVWVGLLVHEVLLRLWVRRPTIRSVLTLAVALSVTVGGVLWAVVHVLEFDPTKFLLDRRLGGRFHQLEGLGEATLLPSVRFDTIWEIVYASILAQFGILGLVGFLVGLATPLALHFLGCVPDHKTAYKRALGAGLATYLVISISDGGALLIPIMAFFWFVASLLLSGNPTWRAAEGRPERGASAEPEAESSPGVAPNESKDSTTPALVPA